VSFEEGTKAGEINFIETDEAKKTAKICFIAFAG
jgi:hypothetical protein